MILKIFSLLSILLSCSFAQISDEPHNAIIHLFTQSELDEYTGIKSEEEQKEFISDYWSNLSHGENASSSELHNEFDLRVSFADSSFDAVDKPGWKSDQGRIYILFGKPDEIIYNPFSDRKLINQFFQFGNFETWYYESPKGLQEIPAVFDDLNDGRTFFVFRKSPGYADYEQIFSTELGEKISAEVNLDTLPIKR